MKRCKGRHGLRKRDAQRATMLLSARSFRPVSYAYLRSTPDPATTTAVQVRTAPIHAGSDDLMGRVLRICRRFAESWMEKKAKKGTLRENK
jgi:hypothetical protein